MALSAVVGLWMAGAMNLASVPHLPVQLALSGDSTLASTAVPTASSFPDCRGQAIFTDTNCTGDGWEPEEERLYTFVNQYRAEFDLPPIPRSPSLTLLANRHVLDMAYNIGHLTHSWSNCPYNTRNRRTLTCSSDAAWRLGTKYPGKAYENAHYNSRGATAESALRGWQNSPAHNALMVNLNNWRDDDWKAMGIGIYKQYAVLWVGEDRDPETAAIASIDLENRAENPPAADSGQTTRRRGFRFPVRIRIR